MTSVLESCAACGKTDLNLKSCGSCMLVKYSALIAKRPIDRNTRRPAKNELPSYSMRNCSQCRRQGKNVPSACYICRYKLMNVPTCNAAAKVSAMAADIV